MMAETDFFPLAFRLSVFRGVHLDTRGRLGALLGETGVPCRPSACNPATLEHHPGPPSAYQGPYPYPVGLRPLLSATVVPGGAGQGGLGVKAYLELPPEGSLVAHLLPFLRPWAQCWWLGGLGHPTLSTGTSSAPGDFLAVASTPCRSGPSSRKLTRQ